MESCTRPTIRSILPSDPPGNYTECRFLLDWKRFSSAAYPCTGLTPDMIAVLKRRALDAAGTCASVPATDAHPARPGLAVYWNGERLPIVSYKQYVHLFLRSRAPSLVFERTTPTSIVCVAPWPWTCESSRPSRVEVPASQLETVPRHFSHVNRIPTMSGGSHVIAIQTQVVKFFLARLTKEFPDIKLPEATIRNLLFVSVHLTVDKPTFYEQYKATLMTAAQSMDAQLELSLESLEELYAGPIYARILQEVQSKTATLLKKGDGSKSRALRGRPSWKRWANANSVMQHGPERNAVENVPCFSSKEVRRRR